MGKVRTEDRPERKGHRLQALLRDAVMKFTPELAVERVCISPPPACSSEQRVSALDRERQDEQ